MPSPTELAEPAGLADPEAAAAELAGCAVPYLIGVRHHSPALSVVVPALLERFRPDVLLLELPPELGEWLPWLADPATTAPVALAGVVGDGGPAFYPFADFSPELAAVRWARANGVPVVPCDLPLADRAWHGGEAVTPEPAAAPDRAAPDAAPGRSMGGALRGSATGRSDDDMWDRVVEARAPGADPEALRRAALLVGWALRDDARRSGGVDPLDLAREAWMRRCLAQARASSQRGEGGGEPRIAAIVGSFHAAALLGAPGDVADTDVADTADAGAAQDGPARRGGAGKQAEVATSLVPYTFALLDSRSGYPAGIRDPQWQQAVLTAGGDRDAVESAVVDAVVAVCARLRAAGHPAGPAEAREAVRLAVDLARLRGLPAPGRGELIEALGSVLAHGEVLGRGRAVAAAMEAVLVGDRRGELAPGTPRSGLRPFVAKLVGRLRLPGPGDAAKDLRLDPLRSDLDRQREVTLQQLAVCHVPYAKAVPTEGVGGVDALTSRWQVGWGPETEAMLDVAGIRGVTLAQAAEGMLREQRRRQLADGGPGAAEVIGGLEAAAVCGLTGLAAQRLDEVAELVPAGATLTEAINALALLDRLRLGHVPGLPDPAAAGLADVAAVAAEVEAAAVRQVDGLTGSEDVADARALAELVHRADASGVELRLSDALARLAAQGSPMIAGAASGVRVLLGQGDPAELGRRIGSWVDNATGPDSRRDLQSHLTGLLAVAEALLQSGGDTLAGLLDRVEQLPDDAFLSRLPALRGGFHVLSPAARDRLLAVVDERVGEQAAGSVGAVDDPQALLVRLLADRAGRQALAAYGLTPPEAARDTVPEDEPEAVPQAQPREQSRELGAADRWRLILGRSRGLGGSARRYASALDEMYGAGRGEGAADDAAGRAGREAPFPGVREWAEELSALFGAGVREEVLARAVEGGRLDVIAELDPGAVRPSVELLQNVLALAGGLPESSLARLRPLVARIVDALTKELASKLRPALSGLTTPRPTYRPGGPLDLPRTLRANLAASRRDADGRLVLVPERPVFRTRARRGVDWRLILVVDVSGSMEASVIWSALTAAVLAGVPALETHFVAFSTEVVDLTDRAHDPLGLLLEVRVGGGTHIAAGLRYARDLVTVPARTMVVVVSDFEEGYPMGGLLAQTRALVESGVTVLGCASLDDEGRPRYSVAAAGQLVAAGMPVAALSPLELARWVGEQVRK